jgi:exo-beta-1,3-glucanase (GH17 family)
MKAVTRVELPRPSRESASARTAAWRVCARTVMLAGAALILLLVHSVAVLQGFIPAYQLEGLSFSPYIDGQDPNSGTFVSESQLRSRMQLVADSTKWFRTFGATNGLEKAGVVAHSLGHPIAMGAWLGTDTAANERELANLIAAANAGELDMAIVGSEVLLRRDLSEAQLIAHVQRVKGQIPSGIPVTTADVYSELLAHPSVLAAVDVVLVNYYPYWEGYRARTAMGAVHEWHQQMKVAAGGKTVIVSETGWPSAGNTIGEAVASAETASAYFLNFVSWARVEGVKYFYF